MIKLGLDEVFCFVAYTIHSFISNVTENLSDHEFEQFVSLFASHAECGPNQSLNIGTRRKLNKIFGREASKLLTIEPKE